MCIQIQQAPAIWFQIGHNLIALVIVLKSRIQYKSLPWKKSLHLSSLSAPEYFCAQYFTDALRKTFMPLNAMFLPLGHEYHNT